MSKTRNLSQFPAIDKTKTPDEVAAIEAELMPVDDIVVESPVDVPKASTPVISLDDIKNALASATPEQKKEFVEAVGLSPSIGKPTTRRKRITNEEIKNMALATGGAAHPDDFLPIPPEHVTEKGQRAIDAWHQQWLDGKTVNWDRMGEAELEEMIATATM